MVQFGAELGAALSDHSLVFLEGELGAGKTTLCRGILQSLGHHGAVKSPTYTIVEPYSLGGKLLEGESLQGVSERKTLYHFDLYRLADPEELEFMGIRDYLAEGNYCLVEWPKRGDGILPEPDLQVLIEVAGLARKLYVQAFTEKGAQAVLKLSASKGGE